MTDFPLIDLIERKRAAWAAAEAGAAEAADHAEVEDEGWNDAALEVLAQYAVGAGDASFMIENVRDYADVVGLNPPPTDRAWGSVTLRAKRAGIIVNAGYGHTSRGPAHAHPGALWRLADG